MSFIHFSPFYSLRIPVDFILLYLILAFDTFLLSQ